jgi:hypothetical protein
MAVRRRSPQHAALFRLQVCSQISGSRGRTGGPPLLARYRGGEKRDSPQSVGGGLVPVGSMAHAHGDAALSGIVEERLEGSRPTLFLADSRHHYCGFLEI